MITFGGSGMPSYLEYLPRSIILILFLPTQIV